MAQPPAAAAVSYASSGLMPPVQGTALAKPINNSAWNHDSTACLSRRRLGDKQVLLFKSCTSITRPPAKSHYVSLIAGAFPRPMPHPMLPISRPQTQGLRGGPTSPLTLNPPSKLILSSTEKNGLLDPFSTSSQAQSNSSPSDEDQDLSCFAVLLSFSEKLGAGSEVSPISLGIASSANLYKRCKLLLNYYM